MHLIAWVPSLVLEFIPYAAGLSYGTTNILIGHSPCLFTYGDDLKNATILNDIFLVLCFVLPLLVTVGIQFYISYKVEAHYKNGTTDETKTAQIVKILYRYPQGFIFFWAPLCIWFFLEVVYRNVVNSSHGNIKLVHGIDFAREASLEAAAAKQVITHSYTSAIECLI